MSPVRIVLVSLLLVLGTNASAAALIEGYPDQVESMDPRDVAILPRYCKSTQLFREKFKTDPAEVDHWYKVLGPGFHALHHYCWAQMQIHRALVLAKTEQVRNFYLSNAAGNIDYVIKYSPPDFVLLPELLTKKGDCLLRINQTSAGVDALQQAIRRKPDYWPPYVVMADYFKKVGDTKDARQWIQKGLQAAPNTPALLRRQRELDEMPKSANSATPSTLQREK